MLENIDLNVSEIKSMCKKCEIDFDHIWKEITELISFRKMSVLCARQKRNGFLLWFYFRSHWHYHFSYARP